MQCKNRLHHSIDSSIAFCWNLLFLTSLYSSPENKLVFKITLINVLLTQRVIVNSSCHQSGQLPSRCHNETIWCGNLSRAQPLLEPLGCVLFFFSVGNLGGGVHCSENVGQLLYVHRERNLLQKQTSAPRPDWWHDSQMGEVDRSGAEKQIKEWFMERRWFLWSIWWVYAVKALLWESDSAHVYSALVIFFSIVDRSFSHFICL